VNSHLHEKCPRCKVSIGRQDTLCWACRHVLKKPSDYNANIWLVVTLKVLAAGVLVAFLLKFRTQVEGTLQAAVRSLLKH
jgi:hypothetical protein